MSTRQRRLSPEFSAIPTPVFAWERRGNDLVLVDWNLAAERQTQGLVVKLAGESASKVYASQPSVLRRLRETRPGDEPRAEECEYVMLANGERRTLNVCYIPSGDDLVLAVTEDLTAHRDAERALAESERRYRTLVEGAPVGIVVHRDGRILYVNDAFAKIAGAADPRSLVGTAVLDLVHPDDRASVAARVRGIEEGGTAPLVEERLLRADGSVIHAEITGIPTTFDGEPAVQAIVRDVSAGRKAQSLFVALSEQALTGIAVVQDATLLYANPRCAELFGYDSPDQMIGLPHAALIAPSARDHTLDMLRRLVADGRKTLQFQCTGRRRDGSDFELEVFSAVIDLDGRPAIVATLLDATERERMAAQLRQAQKMDAVGRLAGGIAHDFNNILTAIISYADLVLSEVPESNPIHSDVVEIRSAGERAAALTRQLLAFSRQQAMETRVVDVGSIVSGMAKMLQRLIDARIALTIDADASAPKVRADRAQLEQVLLNLAVNARDAMPRGGTLDIRTGSSSFGEADVRDHPGLQPGLYAHIRVSDTGPGIPDEVLPRIFEPFFTTKPSGEGTGLGLSVVYGIVKQSGGYVMVDSRLGEGTTFTVLLPALAED
ncbi:MAG TPA: PAS domain S-box protein [Gemmatimonadaceae bacterium]|nr:PAS domain S-box protein [Gemmatimonadaceae bacterium]